MRPGKEEWTYLPRKPFDSNKSNCHVVPDDEVLYLIMKSDAGGRIQTQTSLSQEDEGVNGRGQVSDNRGNWKHTPTMITEFMCQLGQAMVPRYLVRHYSRCSCKGGFFLETICILVGGLIFGEGGSVI